MTAEVPPRIPDPDVRAVHAGQHLTAEWDLTQGTRIYQFDLAALRALLVRAACPIVCRGYLDGGENWHQLCLDKADKALAALEVFDG